MLALLFDLDGTLFDTLDAIMAATNAALAEIGEPPLRTEELRPLIGIPIDRQMAMLRKVAGPAAASVAESYYRHFVRHVRRGVRAYPGVRDTLRDLAGHAIGTMTTRRREVAVLMLRKAGIDGYFRAIVGGDEVSRPKPDPDLPRFAAQSLGVAPRDCIVVGDAPVDILAGRAAGTWTVAAMYGYGNEEEIRAARPHAEIDEISDLPRVVEDLESRAARATS